MLGWRWFAARIGGALVTLLGVTIVVFVVLRAIPGDTITASLGIESGTLTAEQKASLRHFYGIDKPWPAQLWSWLTGVVQGDFGLSLISGKPVTELLRTALPVTIELAVLAAVIGTVAGVALGVIAGNRPGRAGDSVTQGVALLGLAVPEFVIGTVVVAVLAQAFHYFPDTSTFVPLTRSEYVEVAQADYVRTARGKGVRPGRIRRMHVLRNATIPIVTLTGIQFGYLLGGTVIIEQIFALPGMGRLLFTAISDRDYPVVQATVLVIAALFVVVNLVVDLLYRVLDPRTRSS
jgi:peptide/nickel transport system permease protein